MRDRHEVYETHDPNPQDAIRIKVLRFLFNADDNDDKFAAMLYPENSWLVTDHLTTIGAIDMMIRMRKIRKTFLSEMEDYLRERMIECFHIFMRENPGSDRIPLARKKFGDFGSFFQ